MNSWGHHFFQNSNQKLQGILPYPLKYVLSTFLWRKKCSTIQSCISFFRSDFLQNPYFSKLPGQNQISVIFDWNFGRHDDLINSFWIYLTFMKVTFYNWICELFTSITELACSKLLDSLIWIFSVSVIQGKDSAFKKCWNGVSTKTIARKNWENPTAFAQKAASLFRAWRTSNYHCEDARRTKYCVTWEKL